MKPPNKFIPFAPHHIYLGLVMIVAGVLCIPYYTTSAIVFSIVGALIFFDDLLEHTITASTPLRWFFNHYNFWLK